jgi:hypothetical protein
MTYDSTTGVGAINVLEIDCIGYANSIGITGSNQDSTCHSAVNMTRIRCQFAQANQNGILDVGTGTTVNIGCQSAGNTTSSSIGCDTSRPMYNFRCTTGDATVSDYLNNSSVDMVIDGPIKSKVFSGTGSIVLADAIAA